MNGAPQPERWLKIEDLFHSVLDLEPDRRAPFLDAACAGDGYLRQEIESLLASYADGGFTAAPAFHDGIRLLEQRRSHSAAGRRIGPYRIIREIGHGGMGTVFLAARADEAYQKQVAIKVIRHGLDTEDLRHRFHSERQILANLDHPNIMKLLDGGTTDEGLPYFVMEHIAGESVDEYCDTHQLSTAGRLKLFQSICSAVAYAHQNLVIHRDIKPGNVLVTRDGVPHLLDFGIAKLLSPDVSSPAVGVTLTIVRPMTPEYASPEQVRGEIITTASDVYSLGVLLYKLLTGHSPYQLTARSLAAVERAICDGEPEKPSIVIAREENEAAEEGSVARPLTPESVSGTREGTPDKLRRRLRGDLDSIVLMAMRKEPQRRYGSVQQFSEDIRRHLEGLPVVARPDTARYRAAKFVGRHKAGVTAAALLLATLSAGIAATAWQAKVAAAKGERARVEAAKAQRINVFLQDMLSFSSPAYGSPNSQKNPDAKVSEVVEQAAARAEMELADQPEVRADIQRTIGEVYWAQGRYEQAERILRAALTTYVRLYGPDRQETVEASNALANVLLRKGNNAEAEALFRKDIEIERNAEQHGHLDFRAMAHALGDYGSMLDQSGDKAAESYLREALQYASQLTGKERAFVAMLYNDLGDVAYRGGDLNESERLNRAALDEYRKLPDGNYSEMGATLSNLGAVLIKQGKYAEAEPVVREGLELRRKLLGNAHPDTAMSLFRLSDLLYRKGDYQGAEGAAKESIEVFNRAFATPKDNVYFANPVMELGMILNKTGRYREAEGYLRDALEIRTRHLPIGNLLIGASEGVLGECLITQKHFSQAEPLLLDSYKIMKSTLSEHDPRILEAGQRLVTLYQFWGKPEKAVHYVVSLPQANRAQP